MRKGILLIVVVSFSAGSIAQSQEDKLAATLDLTYVSKWMSKGAEAYGRVSMDNSVCKRDVTYIKLSMKYKF